MRRFLSVLLAVLMLVAALPLGALAAGEGKALSYESELYGDASLSAYKQHEMTWSDPVYVKGQAKLTVYFDKANATEVRDVILYVINWNGERIGKESDLSIVTDLVKASAAVESGHRAAVIVVDYGGNENARAGVIENSLAILRTELLSGGTLKLGSTALSVAPGYVYALPAGYRIERDILYFESDKHASLGTLDRVMKAWNDNIAGKKNIYYAYHAESGCSCGGGADCVAGAPMTDASGKVIPHAAQKAPEVTRVEDCRRPDGSPMDYNCRLDIIYPSGAKEKTPVYAVAATQSPRADNIGHTPGRASLVGFTFSGYTTAMFDYVYIPMARDDHYGYIASYGTHTHNAAKSSRAAIRCIRYFARELGYSEELIGVAGISKGSPATALLSVVNNKTVSEQNAYTVTVGGKSVSNKNLYFEGDVIDEKGNVLEATVQPYLTYEQGYDGEYRAGQTEISSEVTVAYAAAGGGAKQLYDTSNPTVQLGAKRSDGSVVTHVPMVLSCGYHDEYGCWDYWDDIQARFAKYAINPYLDFSMEDRGHEYPNGIDPIRDFDRYAAYMAFFHRYLKPNDYTPATAWILPVNGAREVSVNEDIEIKFTAAMDVESVNGNVKLVDVRTGKAVEGEWTASAVNTLFTFTHGGLEAGREYRIEIGGVKDENGVALAETVTKTFFTEAGKALRPVADATTSAAQPDAALGKDKTLALGNKGTNEKMALMTFESVGLRDAGSILLRLWASKPMTVGIYLIDNYSVNEATLTYATAPVDRAVLIKEVSLEAGDNAVELFELAEAVKGESFTLMLRGTGKSTVEMTLAAREDAVGKKLTLIYDAPEAGAPVADTYVSSALPDAVYGKETELRLSNADGASETVFLTYLESHIHKATKIELPVPAGVPNESASIYLLDGYAVDEDALCYNNMPDYEKEGVLLGTFELAAGATLDLSALSGLVKEARFTLVLVARETAAHRYSLDMSDYAVGGKLLAYNSANSTEADQQACYSEKYIFRKGGSMPDLKIANDPEDATNLVATCTSTQTYNRFKLYNTLSRGDFSEADAGRRLRVTFRVRANAAAKISYGMMAPLGSSFFSSPASKSLSLKAETWTSVSYDVALSEVLIAANAGMFTVQLSTKGVQYFFDDFKIVELDGNGNEVVPPAVTLPAREDVTAEPVTLAAEGVEREEPEPLPEDTANPDLPKEPDETGEPDDPQAPTEPDKPTRGFPLWIPIAAGALVLAALAAAILLRRKKEN